MKVITDDKMFMKDMNNIIQYSLGFLDGIEKGKPQFLQGLGKTTIEALKEYIDTMARVDESLLSHVYEWNLSGSPQARLFDIDYIVQGYGLSVNSTFRQSSSIKNGSKVPFYNKAKIMEDGIPVTIAPKNSKVLAFNKDGQDIFTTNPVTVENPGGSNAAGGFEKTFDKFFQVYFTQAFLYASGISAYLQNPVVFKTNMPAGKRGGRSTGLSTGYQWIVKAGTVA